MVAVSPAAPKTAARAAAEEALLDAAERLLADAGYPSITTRRLATEAGVNHGLVHYNFGSNENRWCTRWNGSPAGTAAWSRSTAGATAAQTARQPVTGKRSSPPMPWR
jgi:IS5 family transposase